jgi:hypothetical protein
MKLWKEEKYDKRFTAVGCIPFFEGRKTMKVVFSGSNVT